MKLQELCTCLHFFAVLTFIASSVSSVDHSNFKTCEQSSFCKRHRQFAAPGGQSQFHIQPDSVAATAGSTGLAATLTDGASGRNLSLRLVLMAGGAFRLRLNETEGGGGGRRFEVPPGDALLPGLAEAPARMSRPAGGGMVRLDAADIADMADMAVQIRMRPFRLDLLLGGRPAVSVNSRGLLSWEFLGHHGQAAAGGRPEQFRGHADSAPRGPCAVGADVAFPSASRVYGIPEHADGLSLRPTVGAGDPYRLYNLDVFEYELGSRMALYGSVPVMYAHGTANCTAGAFWHNAAETWVDVGRTDSSGGGGVDTRWVSESGVIDLFLLAGRNPLAVLRQFAALVGATPLPPLFALGYHQSRWNYRDEADALEVDRRFSQSDFPYDSLWLDIEHTDGKRCFTWDSAKFPNPQRLLDSLEASGRRLVTIVDPHVKRDEAWPVYGEARDRRLAVRLPGEGGAAFEGWCWPGTSVWPDFLDPNVRSWWSQKFLSYPAAFTWNDMNEPSVFSGPEVTMPKDAVHYGGWEHRDVHNLYGALVHRASWEGQLLKDPNRRPFVLTRALFAGSQRTAATWTGDNGATWGHLRAAGPMLMSLGLAGVTLAGADVGGFFGDPDPELLTRWYQAGALHPFFRAHAHLDTKRREPWLFEAPHSEAMRAAVLLRYSLMPYLYTQFHLAESDGRPVMAPLWVHHPDDADTFDMDDQHLLGTDLLCKPVTEPGATRVPVYLPRGSSWYLYDSWEPHNGGGTVGVPVSLATTPLFMRAGAVVPRRERRPGRGSAEASAYADPLSLLVLLGRGPGPSSARGSLYVDDGRSLAHTRNGSRLLVDFEFSDGALVSRVRRPGYSPPPGADFVESVAFVGVAARPAGVRVRLLAPPAGEEKAAEASVDFRYDARHRVAVVRRLRLPLTRDWTVRLLPPDGAGAKRDEL